MKIFLCQSQFNGVHTAKAINPKQLSLLIGQLQTLKYAYNMHINLVATWKCNTHNINKFYLF